MSKNITELVKENFAEIKKLVFSEVEETPVALEDVQLVDGTILRIEPLVEVGATVQVIGEDGELMDAPDGDHELEDGRVIKSEGGILIEILEAEGEQEEEMSETEEVVEDANPKLDVEALQNQLISKLNDAIANKIENLKFGEQIEEVKKETEDFKQAVKDLTEMFASFVETPSEEPKKKSRNPFKKEKEGFDYSKLRNFKK